MGPTVSLGTRAQGGHSRVGMAARPSGETLRVWGSGAEVSAGSRGTEAWAAGPGLRAQTSRLFWVLQLESLLEMTFNLSPGA